MPIKHRLTPELRTKLKQPLGILIRGSFNETMKELKQLTAKENPKTIVSIGDTVSKNLVESGFMPNLLIIDNKRMRKSIRPVKLLAKRAIYVKNPQGTITTEAEAAIADAVKQRQRVKIVVDGEEDLLTLLAIMYAPEDSFVIYGQPYEGIVVVKVTQEKKMEISAILDSMRNSSKS